VLGKVSGMGYNCMLDRTQNDFFWDHGGGVRETEGGGEPGGPPGKPIRMSCAQTGGGSLRERGRRPETSRGLSRAAII